MKTAAKDKLETDFVDRYGLAEVVETLAEIAYEKADHIATNWQDIPSSRVWEQAAGLLQTASARIAKKRL